MGLYVEPIKGSKADWFALNGQLVGSKIDPDYIDWTGEVLPVAFLDNGAFHAIAVLWDKKEFKRVTDGRPDAILAVATKSVLRYNIPGGHRLKELK